MYLIICILKYILGIIFRSKIGHFYLICPDFDSILAINQSYIYRILYG